MNRPQIWKAAGLVLLFCGLAGAQTITSFDVPGAVNGTLAFAINPAGAITGTYFDANFVPHGFLRAHNGSFTTFDLRVPVSPRPPASTRQARSRDSTSTQTLCLTAFCGLTTAPSQRSIFHPAVPCSL